MSTAVTDQDKSKTIELEELLGPSEPTFLSLIPSALSTCDRCGGGVEAVVQVRFASGGDLFFCGAHARKHFGYEHTLRAQPENRLQGSDS